MLPAYVTSILREFFTEEEVCEISENWDWFIQIDLSEATRRDIRQSGQDVLDCLKMEEELIRNR